MNRFKTLSRFFGSDFKAKKQKNGILFFSTKISKMKAVVIESFGDESVLQVKENHPIPKAGSTSLFFNHAQILNIEQL